MKPHLAFSVQPECEEMQLCMEECCVATAHDSTYNTLQHAALSNSTELVHGVCCPPKLMPRSVLCLLQEEKLMLFLNESSAIFFFLMCSCQMLYLKRIFIVCKFSSATCKLIDPLWVKAESARKGKN